MTEKRFTYSSEKEGYCLDDEYFCEMEDTEEITMLLNAQQETIRELREWIDDITTRYREQRGIDLENDLE